MSALDSAEVSQLSAELQRVGWAVMPKESGFEASGPDIRIVCVTTSGRGGWSRWICGYAGRCPSRIPSWETLSFSCKTAMRR
jgi:hypothetical protein